MTAQYDAVVIGGGPAGSVAAWHLAAGGARVALIERQLRAHQKVCGEFVSAECLPHLEEMGIDLSAVPVISRFRLHGPARRGEAVLPKSGRGVSRRAMDEAMLRAAGRAGARILRGEGVRRLRRGGHWLIETLSDELSAANVICATGKHEFLPVQRREGRDDQMVGFKLHLQIGADAQRDLDDHVDLFVFEGGYGGMSLVENGLANLCYLLDRSAVEPPKDWAALNDQLSRKCDGLAHYITDGKVAFWPPVTIAGVPYGFVREHAIDDSLYCVGDQLAVVPSLTGAGMGIAMLSGKRAAYHLLRGSGAHAYHRELALFVEPQVRAGYHVHRLFKSPRFSDLAAAVVQKWPGIIELVFRRTRPPVSATASVH